MISCQGKLQDFVETDSDFNQTILNSEGLMEINPDTAMEIIISGSYETNKQTYICY